MFQEVIRCLYFALEQPVWAFWEILVGFLGLVEIKKKHASSHWLDELGQKYACNGK